MPRARLLVSLVAVAVALATAVVLLAVGFDSRGERIAELRRQIVGYQQDASVAQQQTSSVTESLRATERDLRRVRHKWSFETAALGRRIDHLRDRIASPRIGRLHATVRAGRLQMSALVPRGAWVDEVSAIRGSAGHPREVAVVWRTGPPHARTYGAFSPSDGLAVWRADGRDRYGRVVWRLLYSVSHRAGARHRWVGPPGDVHRTWLLAGLSLATRDVTGDGRREVILVEGPTGSGGCTRWRVLGSTGESVDLLFDRDYCDTEVRLRPAALVVRASVYHRGCSIHGCPGLRRVTRFLWDGDSFEPGPSVVVRD